MMNGTVALHLAVHCSGVGPGDEVLVLAVTFVSTANAVAYTGATPVFVDVEPDTWNLSPAGVGALISPRTKAIIPVHLFGHPAAMPELLDLAERYRLVVIEDAAEAHFAKIGARHVGTFGSAGVFSFYGNKILTTGEGGMITTNDEGFAGRLRHLRNNAHTPSSRYWHDAVGFNYRMTSMQAALGLSQLRKLDEIVARKGRRWPTGIVRHSGSFAGSPYQSNAMGSPTSIGCSRF